MCDMRLKFPKTVFLQTLFRYSGVRGGGGSHRNYHDSFPPGDESNYTSGV